MNLKHFLALCLAAVCLELFRRAVADLISGRRTYPDATTSLGCAMTSAGALWMATTA